MNLFEFLMILLSLIVGLGLTEILAGLARFLKKSGKQDIPWIHGTATLATWRPYSYRRNTIPSNRIR